MSAGRLEIGPLAGGRDVRLNGSAASRVRVNLLAGAVEIV